MFSRQKNKTPNTKQNKNTTHNMKLNTRNTKRASGMTLLELTVVILVLLSLISILFIGARAWKKGADRAGCILNIRNVQQAARSFANMNGFNPGDSITSVAATFDAALVGSGLFVENDPTCPGGGTYSGLTATAVPAVGTVLLTCNWSSGSSPSHAPSNTADW